MFCDSYKVVTGSKNLAKFEADMMIAAHVEHFDLSTEPRINKYYAKVSENLSGFLRL
ncbi:hypothetical protein D3C84_1292520 [compost metagenome]